MATWSAVILKQTLVIINELVFLFIIIIIFIIDIHFGLNTDIVIGRDEGILRGMGSVVLDDCSFHEKADLTDFDKDRMIAIPSQDGEVSVE